MASVGAQKAAEVPAGQGGADLWVVPENWVDRGWPL
jgi:hypothetical protein